MRLVLSGNLYGINEAKVASAFLDAFKS